MVPDSHGFIWMSEDGFHRAVAHKASGDQAKIAAAVQRPIAVQCIQEPAPVPLWKSKPSWYLVAEEDRMINPKTQQFHGGSDGRNGSLTSCGPHAHVCGAGSRGRDNSGSCAKDSCAIAPLPRERVRKLKARQRGTPFASLAQLDISRSSSHGNQIRCHRDRRESRHRTG